MTLRIAHIVIPTFGKVFSGHTHYLFSLLSGWKDVDVKLDLIGTEIKPINMNSGERFYRLPNQSFWVDPVWPGRKERIKWSVKIISMLIRQRHDYDIAHFHILNWGVIISPLILHFMGKKAVFTMSQFGNDNPGFISQQQNGKAQVKLLKFFDGFIGISPALTSDAQRFGFRNVICLPNPLSIAGLVDRPTHLSKTKAREVLNISQNKKVILFVGSIIKRKGVDLLIDAFIKTAQQNSDLFLILVGPQNKSEVTKIDDLYVAEQKKKISRAGFTDLTMWTGMVNDQTSLVDYYLAADLFVFPTRNEGLGNVIIEAMAAGLPVVTTLLPGITDILIENGKNGYLIEPENPEELAQKILKLINDRDLCVAMGIHSRSIALEKFGFDAYCDKLKAFYYSLFDISEEISQKTLKNKE